MPRALAYAGVAAYQAAAPTYGGASLVGQLNGLTSVPAPDPNATYDLVAVTNASLAEIAKKLYANTSDDNKAAIDALSAAFDANCRKACDGDVCDVSAAHGVKVADAIYQYSISDGGADAVNNLYPPYAAPTGPDKWVPTPQDNGAPPLPGLLPFWGSNRPFIAGNGNACDPGPPPAFSAEPNSPFYAEALGVYNTVNHLTKNEQAIASFWDDPPGQSPTNAGHIVALLTQFLGDQNAALPMALDSYVRVNVSVSDAAISVWYTKYTYNLLRPVTYLQRYVDNAWLPFLNTPPFPEYSSGHAVFAGAGFGAMTAIFGNNYSFTDRTEELYNPNAQIRSFGTLNEAAFEDGLSRWYGGVHYLSSVSTGLEQGECVQARASSLRLGTGNATCGAP